MALEALDHAVNTLVAATKVSCVALFASQLGLGSTSLGARKLYLGSALLFFGLLQHLIAFHDSIESVTTQPFNGEVQTVVGSGM